MPTSRSHRRAPARSGISSRLARSWKKCRPVVLQAVCLGQCRYHLERALPELPTRRNGRWILVGQFYMKGLAIRLSPDFYELVVRHTFDLYWKSMRRLNSIRRNKNKKRTISKEYRCVVKWPARIVMSPTGTYLLHRPQIELERDTSPAQRTFCSSAHARLPGMRSGAATKTSISGTGQSSYSEKKLSAAKKLL